VEIGISTGRKDSNGIEIKNGDKVLYTQFKKGYLCTSSQDGWGRSISLCRHDQYVIPDKTKLLNGVVMYDQHFTGFIVKFDDYLIDSGRDSDNLYCILNMKDSERFEVI
jgi:hypothetical protein